MLTRFALLLGGTLIGLLVCETVLRVFDLAPRVVSIAHGRYRLAESPVLGYEPTPGFKGLPVVAEGYDYIADEANSLGFRGPDYPQERTPGTFRVAVIGDSLSVGLWVDKYQKTFPSIIEQTLRQNLVGAGITPEVLNFSVVGYNTRQEIAMIEHRAVSFSPDLILIEYCLNDRERNDGALLARLTHLARESKEPLAALEGSWLPRSALYRFLRFRVFPQAQAAASEKPAASILGERERFLSEDSVEDSLRLLGAVYEKHKIPIVVAIFPHFRDLVSYQFSKEHEVVTKTATAPGVTVIDLLDAFRECGTHGLSFDEFHPNDMGHRCAGRALGEALTPLATAREANR